MKVASWPATGATMMEVTRICIQRRMQEDLGMTFDHYVYENEKSLKKVFIAGDYEIKISHDYSHISDDHHFRVVVKRKSSTPAQAASIITGDKP